MAVGISNVVVETNNFILEVIMINILILLFYSLCGLVKYLFKNKFLILFLTDYIILWILGKLFNVYVLADIAEDI